VSAKPPRPGNRTHRSLDQPECCTHERERWNQTWEQPAHRR
jgi:hypothetical protein